MVLPFFDTGAPLLAPYDDAPEALSITTHLCDACGQLHLEGTEVTPGAAARAPDPAALLAFRLDPRTQELRAENDRAEAYLASPRGAWLRAWVEREWDAIRGRYERLAEQRDDAPPDSRRAPMWQPGRPVPHREVFPYDFTPSVACAGETWLIDDAACIDACGPTQEVVLACHDAEGQVVEVAGKLGDRRGRAAEKAGRSLWDAIRADAELLGRLVERSEEVRAAGPFIMAAAYEQARQETRAELRRSLPLDARGGYLQGGAVSVALLRRLYSTATRLYRDRVRLADSLPDWIHVEVRGALARVVWIAFVLDPCFLSLFDVPDEDRVPLLELAVDTRALTTLAHRRQRCALGLPLIAGRYVPLISHGKEEDGPASADDTRLCVAIVEALLGAAPALHDDPVEDDAEPRTLDRRVELDTGTVDVRFTFAHPDAPRVEPEELAPEGTVEEKDAAATDAKPEEEDDDHDDLEADPAGPAREAYTDELVDQGATDEELTLVRLLLRELGLFAEEHDDREPWFSQSCIERFLTDRLPREIYLTEAQIEETPKVFDRFAGWLEEMGHIEAKPLRLTIDRAAPVFRKRARDPRLFSTTKALQVDLGAAGISPQDEAAVSAFLDARKAAPKDAAPAVARSATRWQPAPGEKAPAPTDPCGCGSGRRYKKCCMAR
jgi:hypothetical protein